jgi:ribosome biogenesis GTPase
LLSVASGEGRHTTSASTRYRLPGGGALVDSPGVREFWLPEMPANELMRGFREIAQASDTCRFRDCIHVNEPDCAVRDAVVSGGISKRRYDTYRALLRALT